MTFLNRVDQILGKPYTTANGVEYAEASMQAYREGYRPEHKRRTWYSGRTREQRLRDASVTLWAFNHRNEIPSILGMEAIP